MVQFHLDFNKHHPSTLDPNFINKSKIDFTKENNKIIEFYKQDMTQAPRLELGRDGFSQQQQQQQLQRFKGKTGQFMLLFFSPSRAEVQAQGVSQKEGSQQKRVVIEKYERYICQVVLFYTQLCKGRNLEMIRLLQGQLGFSFEFITYCLRQFRDETPNPRFYHAFLLLFETAFTQSHPLRSLRERVSRFYTQETINAYFDALAQGRNPPLSEIFRPDNLYDIQEEQKNSQQLNANLKHPETEQLKVFRAFLENFRDRPCRWFLQTQDFLPSRETVDPRVLVLEMFHSELFFLRQTLEHCILTDTEVRLLI